MDDEKRTNPIPWEAKIVLGITASLLGFFSEALGGWGVPALVGGAAVVIPTLKYQRYWHGRWFWLTMLALSVFQVPFVILSRPLMDQLKLGSNILFVTLDAFLVAVVVNWVRSKGSIYEGLSVLA
jgi:hypothetical protein